MAAKRSYAKWNEQELQMAIAAYHNGDHGLNECARVYGIPKATLKRHADNKNSYHNGVKVLGRGTTFDEKVERLLAEHILELERVFFGLTITDVRKLAYDLAQQLDIDHRFNHEKKMAGKKWFYNFMRRHPALSLRQPESTSMARVQGFNEENVNGFFDILEQLVDEYHFTGETIYNVDESGFSTVQKKLEKIVAQKGKSQVGGVTSGERGVNTTAVACCNASGHYIPPMIIFKRQRMAQELALGAPIGSLVEVSESGYINSELFVKWLEHFQKHVNARAEKPVLLLLDGHTTHSKNLAAVNFARVNHIRLLQLPGHTTHRLQPLDRSFFKPLGTFYAREQTKWLRQHPGMKITQFQISGLLKNAYGEAATPNNAAAGFDGSGIWPVNRDRFTAADFASAVNLRRPAPVPVDSIPTDAAISTTPQTQTTNTQTTAPPSQNITTLSSSSTIPISAVHLSPKPSTSVAKEDSNSKKSPSTVLKKISPVPKMDDKSTVDGRRRRGRPAGAQKAVELTSSPYKDELMRKKNGAKPKTAKKKGKNTSASGTGRGSKKRLFDDSDTESNVEPLPIENDKPAKRRKTRRATKKAPPQPVVNSSSSHEKSDDNDAACIFCDELYSHSWAARDKAWIRCQKCQGWAHAACADVSPHTKFYMCDLCA